MDKNLGAPDDANDETELMRSEFESIVEGLSLDESSPSTFLDELDRIDHSESFIAPIPLRTGFRASLLKAKAAFMRWFNRDDHDGDGAHV